VFRPGVARAATAVGPDANPVQAYCDLLEVRWLLSERSGQDVGDAVALEALASRETPSESAAKMVVAEGSTGSFQELDADQVDEATTAAAD
jgi:hypothetical protein